MRRFLLAVAAGVMTVSGLAGLSSRASAQDPLHDRYHDELEHREFHRYLEHRDAHRYPMTWQQHEQLHDQLDHERFHDYLEHRQFHRGYYSPSPGYYPYSGSSSSPYQGYGYGGSPYGPAAGYGYGGPSYSPSYGYPGYGFAIQGRRFSLYFGR